MTRAELILKVRFLFDDTNNSNMVYREDLVSRPSNIIDGFNTIFTLLNRRIVAPILLYDRSNVPVPAANYTLDVLHGRLIITPAPVAPLFVDYHWQKLNDAEINEAIDLSKSSGNFDPESVPDSLVDYCARYVVSNCYRMAASRAAEYYTMSAAGKQVSKSELFNHYNSLADSYAKEAQALRTDQRTDRGDREIASMSISESDAADIWFPPKGWP